MKYIYISILKRNSFWIYFLMFTKIYGLFLFIVVGQSLLFSLHVRCSFYHSIHKDNGWPKWVPIPSQKFWRLAKEKSPKKGGSHLIRVIIFFHLCSSPLLRRGYKYNTTGGTFGILPYNLITPLPLGGRALLFLGF